MALAINKREIYFQLCTKSLDGGAAALTPSDSQNSRTTLFASLSESSIPLVMMVLILFQLRIIRPSDRIMIVVVRFRARQPICNIDPEAMHKLANGFSFENSRRAAVT